MAAGRMDFVNRNFEFKTMPLAELVGRCSRPEAFSRPSSLRGERCLSLHACICTCFTAHALKVQWAATALAGATFAALA